MKNNRTETLADVRSAIAQGFTTKQAKKDAGRGLEVELSALNAKAMEQGATYWDLPGYPHEVGKKALALFDGLGLGDQARELVDVRLELKAAEVKKAAPKVDDTKVREAEIADPLSYVDMKGDKRGVCWCCGRSGFKLNAQGRLSRHGYQRPGWGYDVGGCGGTNLTPREALAAAISSTEGAIDRLSALLADPAALAAREVRRLRPLRGGRRASVWHRREVADEIREIRNSGLASPFFVGGLERRRDALIAHLGRAREVMALVEAAA